MVGLPILPREQAPWALIFFSPHTVDFILLLLVFFFEFSEAGLSRFLRSSEAGLSRFLRSSEAGLSRFLRPSEAGLSRFLRPIEYWNIHWGDGTSTMGLPSEPLPQSHTYASGQSTATITVETFDEDGGPYSLQRPIS